MVFFSYKIFKISLKFTDKKFTFLNVQFFFIIKDLNKVYWL